MNKQENNFRTKINKIVNKFIMDRNIWPNELWLGYKEKLQLEDYFNNHESISLADGPVILNEKSNLRIDGLRIRLKDQNSYFKVYYNPHY